MSLPFIVDEWIFHDLLGENENEGPKQLQVAILLERMLSICDHLIVVRGSKFHRKITDVQRVANRSSGNPAAHFLARHFVLSFLPRADKIIYWEEDNLKTLSKELAGLKGLKDDDHYVVQAHLTVPGSQIVTTDQPLISVLGSQEAIDIVHRDAFLSKYLG
jgi:hypothetical protein